MSAWLTVPVTEVLEFREGPGILAVDFHTSGIPLIRLAGLKPGVPLLAGCNYLDPNKVGQKWSHFRLRTGDVLLSTSASLGEVAVVDEASAGAVPYTGLIAFRSTSPLLHPNFVQHLLTSPSFVAQIGAMGVGSVMKHFGPMHLRQMNVSFPAVSQQIAITGVLGVIDKKIALNSSIAGIARELARLQFEAIPPAERVPRQLGDVLDLKYGKALPASSRTPGTATVVGSGGFVGKHEKALVGGPCVVVGRKGSVGSTYWIPGPTFPIDTTFFVVPKKDASLLYCYFLLRSLDLAGMNSDSAVPGLNRSEALALPVMVPDSTAMLDASERAMRLFGLATQHDKENQTLAELRGILLPALMSGCLRVKDAERQFEDAI